MAKNPQFNRKDQDEIHQRVALRSPLIYEIIRKDGVVELSRPAKSLFWSGIAAGLALSLSVYCEGALYHALRDTSFQVAGSSFGYSVGFLIVILGRLQLFTENTITVVLPVLADFKWHRISQLIRLWGIVFVTNLIGSFLSAWMAYGGGILPPDLITASLAISEPLLGYSFSQSLLYGIPAGFIIASVVWIRPNVKSDGFFTILFLISMISLCGFTHVIAGSTEWFLLAFNNQTGWIHAFFNGIFPTLIGNLIGGTGLFALVAYAQVKEEI